jgi:putative membrane protein
MMWRDGGGWGWGWMVMGMVMMVGFWALVAWVIFIVVRRPESRSSAGDAQQILAERFARGELDVDEYRQRSDALRTH